MRECVGGCACMHAVQCLPPVLPSSLRFLLAEELGLGTDYVGCEASLFPSGLGLTEI